MSKDNSSKDSTQQEKTIKKRELIDYDFHPDSAVKKFLTEISHPRLIAMINEILGTKYPTDSEVSWGMTEYFSALGDLDKDSVRGDLVATIGTEEKTETTNKILVELQTTKDESMGFRMFVYSLNASKKQKDTDIHVFPKGLIIYTLLGKEKSGKELVQFQLDEFYGGEHQYLAKNGELLGIPFSFYNALANDLTDFQNSPLEILQLLWLYRYRKNDRLIQKSPEFENTLHTLNQYVQMQEGQDKLVMSGLYSDLIKDLIKICEKQGYQKELDMVNTLNITYSDYLLAIGMEEGMEKGREEGMEKGILTVAKKMLNRFSMEEISESTGLSLEQIQALQEEQQ